MMTVELACKRTDERSHLGHPLSGTQKLEKSLEQFCSGLIGWLTVMQAQRYGLPRT